MFGSHLSTAGGLHNALLDAKRLAMSCVQVFTKSQRTWRCSPITAEALGVWQQHRRDIPLDSVVSHDSYLINLASPNPELLQKSLDCFRDELERCEMLAIPYLVTHPGAHVGEGEEAGLRRVAESLDKVHADLPGYRTITCLEITAGQGSCLGHRLEHLRDIIAMVREPERLGVCIDSAHSLEAGYDLTSGAGAKAFLGEIDDVIGLDRVKVMHLNDSKTPRGSRVDRHEHIGRGHVALDAFAAIVNHPKLKRVPKILETPKDKDEHGEDWDTVNLRTLTALITRRGRDVKAPKGKKGASPRPI